MESYRLRLDIFFFNVCIYGDISLEEDMQNIQYWEHDLEKFGYSGTIMLGKTLSSLTVAANNSEIIDDDSIDPETMTAVEVVVDEKAGRRDDAFFEKVMPIGAKGLSIVQVAESDRLPIIDNEEVYVPIPWSGLSTIQLVAPNGFVRDLEDNYVVNSLLIVVSPEIPQA